MEQADMNEYRGNEPPDFSLVNLQIRFHPEREKRGLIRCAASQLHNDEDKNIDAQNDFGKQSGAREEGLSEFEIPFFGHEFELRILQIGFQLAGDLRGSLAGALKIFRFKGY